MKRLNEAVINFFQNQGCVIVSTIDRQGFAHSSCKGLVKMNSKGEVYLLDLYKARTFENLKRNPQMSMTAIDEHRFIGYCLKGKAQILSAREMQPQIIKAWEDRITGRITRRLLRNIHEEKGHPRHPEILLPRPQYLILMKVEEVVDLTPHQLK